MLNGVSFASDTMERPSSSHSRALAAAKARAAGFVRRLASTLALLSAAACASTSRADDRIYLISTRGIGVRCECSAMAAGLRCEQLIRDSDGAGRWQSVPWSDLAAELANPLPTAVFVHGNRIERGDDKPHGLAFYRSIAARQSSDGPIRFIIWSWPSEKVPGIVKDYQVKAARAKPAGWQLAWAVDQMPAETPLALVGYSYGARIVTGALHLLAGGRLDELQLAERAHPNREPVRAALLAAALDANWIRPGGYHGRALEQVDQLLLVNNQLDPAMRFYHFAVEGRVRPLGFMGPPTVAGLGALADRVHSVDVTSAVGRHHALENYLTASRRVGHVLEEVMHLRPAQTPTAGRSSHRQ